MREAVVAAVAARNLPTTDTTDPSKEYLVKYMIDMLTKVKERRP
jgi:hypothetical protein